MASRDGIPARFLLASVLLEIALLLGAYLLKLILLT